jgi:hypothetical protein
MRHNLGPCRNSLEPFHGLVAFLDPEEQRATHFEAGDATFPNPIFDRPWTDAVTVSDGLLRDQIATGYFLRRQLGFTLNSLWFDAPRVKFGIPSVEIIRHG